MGTFLGGHFRSLTKVSPLGRGETSLQVSFRSPGPNFNFRGQRIQWEERRALVLGCCCLALLAAGFFIASSFQLSRRLHQIIGGARASLVIEGGRELELQFKMPNKVLINTI